MVPIICHKVRFKFHVLRILQFEKKVLCICAALLHLKARVLRILHQSMMGKPTGGEKETKGKKKKKKKKKEKNGKFETFLFLVQLQNSANKFFPFFYIT